MNKYSQGRRQQYPTENPFMSFLVFTGLMALSFLITLI